MLQSSSFLASPISNDTALGKKIGHIPARWVVHSCVRCAACVVIVSLECVCRGGELQVRYAWWPLRHGCWDRQLQAGGSNAVEGLMRESFACHCERRRQVCGGDCVVQVQIARKWSGDSSGAWAVVTGAVVVMGVGGLACSLSTLRTGPESFGGGLLSKARSRRHLLASC